MRDIRSGHYRFFILLFGLQMKRGAGARRLSLMKERSQISSESYEWEEGGGERRQRSFVEIFIWPYRARKETNSVGVLGE